MTDLSEVRIATIADRPAILALCHLLHAENGLFSMDDDKVNAVLDKAFGRQGGIIGVIDGPDGLEGAICLEIGPATWYTTEWAVIEIFNFVHPDHRRSNHAKALIGFMKQCAVAMSIPLFTGIITEDRLEAKARLYARQLPKIGEFFLFNYHPAHVA